MALGLGHMHMNQMKTFQILDNALLEPLGKDVLNFFSPKVYNYFFDPKDTYKHWQT